MAVIGLDLGATKLAGALFGRDGSILGTYGSGEEPGGPTMAAAIDAALARTV